VVCEGSGDFIGAEVLVLQTFIGGVGETAFASGRIHGKHAVLGKKAVVEAEITLGV
jgi:hypothetical protein